MGCGSFATATNSQLSSYSPIVVINGVKKDPVESTEPLKSQCSNPALIFVSTLDVNLKSKISPVLNIDFLRIYLTPGFRSEERRVGKD